MSRYLPLPPLCPETATALFEWYRSRESPLDFPPDGPIQRELTITARALNEVHSATGGDPRPEAVCAVLGIHRAGLVHATRMAAEMSGVGAVRPGMDPADECLLLGQTILHLLCWRGMVALGADRMQIELQEARDRDIAALVRDGLSQDEAMVLAASSISPETTEIARAYGYGPAHLEASRRYIERMRAAREKTE